MSEKSEQLGVCRMLDISISHTRSHKRGCSRETGAVTGGIKHPRLRVNKCSKLSCDDI